MHFSFATRLLYKATTRFEDTQPQPVKAVIAQLVASSFRKETDNTLGFHRDGYDLRAATHRCGSWSRTTHARRATSAGTCPLGSEKAVGQRGLVVATPSCRSTP